MTSVTLRTLREGLRGWWCAGALVTGAQGSPARDRNRCFPALAEAGGAKGGRSTSERLSPSLRTHGPLATRLM